MNKKDTARYLVFLSLIAIAFFLRFYNLDERVFHHDEAAVGYFTYKLFDDGLYAYNPSFHGPFMYFATSEMFRLFGDSVFTARLLPALLGASMIFFLFPLRRYTGNNGIVLIAFFLAFSPSFLYYSRFYREDIFMSFFSLLALFCAVKYTEEHVKDGYSILRIVYLFILGAALASLAALKENAYIIMALLVFFLVLIFIREKWYQGLIDKIKRHDRKVTIISAEGMFLVLSGLVFFSLYYTGHPLDLSGMKDAIEKAVLHWYEMHRIERMGGPFYFYLPIMALYELPVMAFGFAGLVHYYNKNDMFMTFIGYWAITNLIIYSYLQEKVPWLILNPLLPLTIIAGAYLGKILPGLKFNNRTGAFVIIFLIASSSYFIYSGALLNYSHYTDPAEPLIQAAQPPQKFSEFLDKINEISSQYNNRSTDIQVLDTGVETQFLWYLRHYDNIKWKVSIESDLVAPIIVVHDTDGDESEADIVKRRLRFDYERLDSAKMSWYWFKTSDITPGYLLYREMDRPPGEYRVVLYYMPKY